MTSDSAGITAVNSYISVEDNLFDLLRIVPFSKENLGVWSPRLVTVIMESCSQMDSLLKYRCDQSKYSDPDPKITHYFEYFGEELSRKWVVFWGEEPHQIRPFDHWSRGEKYSRENYVKLDWWDAYNGLKHNRLTNRSRATLGCAVSALAGLFLAILGSEFCYDAIGQTSWLTGNTLNPQACLGEDSNIREYYVLAETKLFAYPVGWTKNPILKDAQWLGHCSQRFRDWFVQYVEQNGV